MTKKRADAGKSADKARAAKPRRIASLSEADATRLERELADAAAIQAALLPAKIPEIPGYDIFPFYRSAAEIGGDYYDLFPLDRERLGMVVADASPTGIPGCIIMAMTRTLVRTLAPTCDSCVETLRRVNACLGREIVRGMFMTALFAELDVAGRELTVCSAGHSPAMVFRARTGELEFVGTGAIALGVESEEFFDRTVTTERVSLEAGDRVVLYTNGVVKVRDTRDKPYGTERLHRFVTTHGGEHSREFVQDLIRELDDHRGDKEQVDDIAVLVLRVEPA